MHRFRRTDANLHPKLKLSCRLMATPPGQAEPSSVTIEQESSEEGSELVVRVEREHVCNMLVRTNDDNRPLLPVDTAQLEDVRAVLKVGRVGFLVVDQPEPPLAGKQKRWQLLDLEVAMPLLEDRANVDDAVDVRAVRREAPDRQGASPPSWTTQQKCFTLGSSAP